MSWLARMRQFSSLTLNLIFYPTSVISHLWALEGTAASIAAQTAGFLHCHYGGKALLHQDNSLTQRGCPFYQAQQSAAIQQPPPCSCILQKTHPNN